MRRLFAVCILIVVFTTLLLAAIVRDFSQGQSPTGSASTTHTFTSAAPANSNRLLIAVVTTNSDTVDTTGATFNTSETMLANATATIGSLGFVTAETWSLVAPTATTANVVATTNNPLTSSMYVVALSGVDQATPFRDRSEEQSATGTTMATGNLTLTTVSGDFVLSCIRIRDTGANDPGALVPNSGTEFNEALVVANSRSACSYETATTTSTTVGWTWPNGAYYAHVAMAVAPSGGGGGSNPVPIFVSNRGRRQ